MTVVEAAAFGAPTMLHADGDIGAAEFLRPGVESSANMEGVSAEIAADRVKRFSSIPTRASSQPPPRLERWLGTNRASRNRCVIF